MFWLEEQWGDPPGDREGSSCFSPLQETTREERKGKESKSIHFPVTSLECLGRGGSRGSWV